MVNRWLGIVCLSLMASANLAIFLRDVLPAWSSGDPPEGLAHNLRPGMSLQTQVGLFDARGRRIGSSWTHAEKTSDQLVRVRSWTVLTNGALPALRLPAGYLRIDTDLTYTSEPRLDELSVRVRGLGIPIELRGQFVPPNDFPCQWIAGSQSGYFVIPAYATRAVGDIVRPFESLSGLYVGQSWKLQLVNPLAGMLPGGSDHGLLGPEVLVRVTRTEPIVYAGKRYEAFVLEAPRMRAWALPDGRVVRQEVDLPVIGKLILQQEPYNDARRRELLSRFPSQPPRRPAPEGTP